MRTLTLAPAFVRSVLACCLALLALPVSNARAQDDLDEMMAADPDQPAEDAEEGGDEGEAEAAPDGEKAPAGEQGSDEERPPDELEEQTDEDKTDVPTEPVDDPSKGFRIGALIGYGASLEDANPWGPGFGLQAVYDLGAFVIGARFVYYVGETVEIPKIDAFEDVIGSESATINVWELGIDAGVDLALSPAVTLRPGLGLGFASLARGSSSELNGAVSPGLALLFAATDSFYVGVDARFQVVTASPEAFKALIFLAAAGVRL
jgi:hypothetical protein